MPIVGGACDELIHMSERPSVALEKTPEFLKAHMPNCYALASNELAESLKLDLSGASKSPLAAEVLSALAALAEAPGLPGRSSDVKEVLGYVASEFGKRFEVEVDGGLNSSLKQETKDAAMGPVLDVELCNFAAALAAYYFDVPPNVLPPVFNDTAARNATGGAQN